MKQGQALSSTWCSLRKKPARAFPVVRGVAGDSGWIGRSPTPFQRQQLRRQPCHRGKFDPPKALYKLAAPSTPPEVQAEVERRVAAGEAASAAAFSLAARRCSIQCSALAHWWPTPLKYGGGLGGARRASAFNS